METLPNHCQKENYHDSVVENSYFTQQNPFFFFKLTDPLVYYIYPNLSNLLKPQFFRKKCKILYSKEFTNNKWKNCLRNFQKNFLSIQLNEDKEKYFSEIFTQYLEFKNFLIEWLTISNTKIKITCIYTICKIQFTAKSSLVATYSIFIPQELNKTESAIEIFANSKAVFKHCHFANAERVGVIVRNYSSVRFEDCTFENNKISCFIMDDSYAEFYNCQFKNDQNISVFVTKDSNCYMENCEFNHIAGKAIFAKDSSRVYLTKMKFIDCEKGAATIAEGSSLFLDKEILIQNPQNTALRAIKNSHIKAIDVKIYNANGNAINIENSDGFFFNCEMKGTIHPTIAVIGRKANPIFNNCKLTDNQQTFCVICKNSCRPLFLNCIFSDCSTNCISVSDSSRPHFENCSFGQIGMKIINAFSGSIVTYKNLFPIDKSDIPITIYNSPSARCTEIALNDVIRQDELESEQNNDDDDDELSSPNHVRSWRSPTYELPPQLPTMNEPDEIVNGAIKPLQILKLSQVIRHVESNPTAFICSHCRHELTQLDEPNIICPCGHIICNDCKNDLSKCPICDSPVKDVTKIYFEEKCSICLEKDSNTVSIPCGHFCMCYECASKCAEMNFNCPMCNKPLNTYKFAYEDVIRANMEQNDEELITGNKINILGDNSSINMYEEVINELHKSEQDSDFQ